MIFLAFMNELYPTRFCAFTKSTLHIKQDGFQISISTRTPMNIINKMSIHLNFESTLCNKLSQFEISNYYRLYL